MAEAAREKSAEEQEEWDKEVEEARRLHEDEGFSAADAVAKAHSEAVWLREERAKKEHEARVAEIDARFEEAEKKEKKRLMKEEDMTKADAGEDGAFRGRWLRRRSWRNLSATRQMVAEESRKKDLSREFDEDGDGDADGNPKEAEVGEREADSSGSSARRGMVEAQFAGDYRTWTP